MVLANHAVELTVLFMITLDSFTNSASKFKYVATSVNTSFVCTSVLFSVVSMIWDSISTAAPYVSLVSYYEMIIMHI